MTLRFVSKVLVIFVALACAAACFAQSQRSPFMPSATPAAKDANIPADTNTVIISYGAEKLTLKEILYFIPEPKSDYIKRMADQWLDLQLLYNSAKQKGLTNDPKTKLMADLNAKQVFAREVTTKIASEVNVPEATIHEYYEKNKATDPQFSEPNKFSFTHIRVKTIAEANTVANRIKAGEEPSAIAKALSIAPDAKNGGIVKKAPQPNLYRMFGADFAKAIETGSEGQIIGPVAVNGEFEVARFEGKLSAKAIPFEQVRGMIKSNLEQKEKGEATQKYLDTLRQEVRQLS